PKCPDIAFLERLPKSALSDDLEQAVAKLCLLVEDRRIARQDIRFVVCRPDVEVIGSLLVLHGLSGLVQNKKADASKWRHRPFVVLARATRFGGIAALWHYYIST